MEYNKAEQRAFEAYPPKYAKQERHPKRVQSEKVDTHQPMRAIYIKGYQQAEKDVAEAFAKIIRGNLGRIGNDIQNMFEQLYTEITGEKMYKGFKD